MEKEYFVMDDRIYSSGLDTEPIPDEEDDKIMTEVMEKFGLKAEDE